MNGYPPLTATMESLRRACLVTFAEIERQKANANLWHHEWEVAKAEIERLKAENAGALDILKKAAARLLVLETEVERLRAALKPFADYADPHGTMPTNMVITNGSPMGKRQLTMGDCYAAHRAFGEPQS